jgi:hypothetical protein
MSLSSAISAKARGEPGGGGGGRSTLASTCSGARRATPDLLRRQARDALLRRDRAGEHQPGEQGNSGAAQRNRHDALP